MTHLDHELQRLKDEIISMMWEVKTQLVKSKEAVFNFDESLAEEIISTEKIINAHEIKIDRDCENTLALYNPVAIDLRFVMACFKINTHLERMGDNADGIAKYIIKMKGPLPEDALKRYRLDEMYSVVFEMVDDVIEAYENEDTTLARKVFRKDKIINEINSKGADLAVKMILEDPEQANNYLYLLSLIRKLERTGDLTKNIAEEFIFYIEAKIMKHRKQQKKEDKLRQEK